MISALIDFRSQLNEVFADDTAFPGTVRNVPSSGHCAVVSLVVRGTFGGDLVSVKLDGVSHWFNRIMVVDGFVEVDLTGDQFGFHPVNVSQVGTHLYGSSRVRSRRELSEETLKRLKIFSGRMSKSDEMLAGSKIN